ncbi:hypothetical protein [Rhizobium sp. BR 249]|uniref:hypothetical protein n=1 Tax=Rhizobium sp. BR 249 TaxID=3040011 RepID=UPI0039BEF9C2
MLAINLDPSEKMALKSIDPRELRTLIDQAIAVERTGALYGLPLSSCGPYVSSKYRSFQQAVHDYSVAKSAKKRGETHDRAVRAGYDLTHAIHQMQDRMDTEEREGELFYVDDNLHWPTHFSRHLRVSISYRWRQSVDDNWSHGRITFAHEYAPRLNLAEPRPKRKPSAAKQARELEDQLAREWEHLAGLALYSVREFFREGGDGGKIPEDFTAKTDTRGGLNNFSARFWDDKGSSRNDIA